jgi:hypothetical protein
MAKTTKAPAQNTETPEQRYNELISMRRDHDKTVINWVDQQLRQAEKTRQNFGKAVEEKSVFELQNFLQHYTSNLQRALVVLNILGHAKQNLTEDPTWASQWVNSTKERIQNQLAQGSWLKQSTSAMGNLMNTWEFQEYCDWLQVLDMFKADFERNEKAISELQTKHPEFELPAKL